MCRPQSAVSLRGRTPDSSWSCCSDLCAMRTRKLYNRYLHRQRPFNQLMTSSESPRTSSRLLEGSTVAPLLREQSRNRVSNDLMFNILYAPSRNSPFDCCHWVLAALCFQSSPKTFLNTVSHPRWHPVLVCLHCIVTCAGSRIAPSACCHLQVCPSHHRMQSGRKH